jgi:hypothetical protein
MTKVRCWSYEILQSLANCVTAIGFKSAGQAAWEVFPMMGNTAGMVRSDVN